MDFFEDLDVFGFMFEEKYGFFEVYVVFFLIFDYVGIIYDLSCYGVEYMYEMVKDGDIVGVSWGIIMY